MTDAGAVIDTSEVGDDESGEREVVPRLRRRRLVLWLLVMMVVGAAGIAWAVPSVAAARQALDRLAGIGVWAPLTILAGTLIMVVTEAVRIIVVGRIVDVKVRPGDAIDAAVANQVLTAVTPSAGLGEPAVAYMLRRRGVSSDAAVVIPLVKFATSFVFIFGLGALLVAFRQGPRPDSWLSMPAALGLLALAASMSALIFGGLHPEAAGRTIDRLEHFLAGRRVLSGPRAQARVVRAANSARRAVGLLTRLRARGPRAIVALIAVHVLYYAGYVITLPLLAWMIADAPPVAVMTRALTYLCWVFVMPTPGGVGLGEAAAVVFFDDVLTPPDAIAVVIGFRLATLYVPVVLGAIYAPGRLLMRRLL
jgi:uncharacterized protein (TIRG00374 family)